MLIFKEFYIHSTDNAAIHHVQEVHNIIRDAGAILMYLPPYSPDLNPIEMTFSYVKEFLKDNERAFQCTAHIYTFILCAFSVIDNDLCTAYFRHIGYL